MQQDAFYYYFYASSPQTATPGEVGKSHKLLKSIQKLLICFFSLPFCMKPFTSSRTQIFVHDIWLPENSMLSLFPK